MEPQFIEIPEDEYNALQDELSELKMTLLTREGEIDSMSEQIADLKEQYKSAISSRDEQMLIRAIAERAMLTGSCGEYIQRLADPEAITKLSARKLRDVIGMNVDGRGFCMDQEQIDAVWAVIDQLNGGQE